MGKRLCQATAVQIAATRGEPIQGGAVLNKKGSGRDLLHAKPRADPPADSGAAVGQVRLWEGGIGGPEGMPGAAPALLKAKSQLEGRFPPQRGQDSGRRQKGNVWASPFALRVLPGCRSCEQRHPLKGRQEQAAPALTCQDTGSPWLSPGELGRGGGARRPH